jgi:hypothetical protein
MNASFIDPTAGTSIDLKNEDIGQTIGSPKVDREVGDSDYVRPKGPKIFGIQLPAYRSPIVQTDLHHRTSPLPCGKLAIPS